LIEEHQKSKTTVREIARLEKQKRLADNLREKIDASENGVDVDRKKNWEWTIEQNEGWAKREQSKRENVKEFDGGSRESDPIDHLTA
jgi:pre-mRNA-splicing factor SYF2